MKIFVTGGAGFIGSALVRHLVAHTDDQVLVIDKLTYAGNLASLSSVERHPRYRFGRTDICDRSAVAPAWPAEPVGVAQPATRRMRARIPLVLVACIRLRRATYRVVVASPSLKPDRLAFWRKHPSQLIFG